ncbi:MAG: glycoside hydrolase family 1 protein [Novosphingobium sp.]|nr:glycoside hydrolase family 1 protein [Novosphingobium sp.]
MARRDLMASSVAALVTAAAPAIARAASTGGFPKGFLWGAATAGHQVEGNKINADQWLLETVKPALPQSPSGDACNSFELWRTDLDIARDLNFNAYRFSVEWPRIEPEEGMFSVAMLDHYRAIARGCRERGLAPVITLCHFTTPRWFAARGGWTSDAAPPLFARYCEKVIRHLGEDVAYVATLNEPNNALLLQSVLPEQFWLALRASLAACTKATGGSHFTVGNTVLPEDVEAVTRNMLDGHRLAKAAIKAVRPDLPVGVTLAVLDDQASGKDSLREAMRERFYGAWLRAARDDDFVGVQNYERAVWGAKGKLPAPESAPKNYSGAEIYPASLANAVRYVHEVTGKPILVTEHGVGTPDDRKRAALIPAALQHLDAVMAAGVPVLGYIHWSLLDNYEWGGSRDAEFGLVAVDRQTFARSLKPSATVLAAIARKNSV